MKGSHEQTETTSYWKESAIGGCVLLWIALTWTAVVQFVKSSVSSSAVDAPFALTCFNTSWMIWCYPMFLAGFCLNRKCRGSLVDEEPLLYHVKFHTLVRLFGDGSDRYTTVYFVRLVTRCSLFAAGWSTANNAYYEALSRITATEASVISSTNLAFVYILSFLFLKDKFSVPKTLALLFAAGGIFCVSYATGFGGFHFAGVILALVSALSAAVYKVFFKVYLGSATLGQVTFFLSMIGICDVTMFAPIAAGLLLSGQQYIDWPNAPWFYIAGSAVLGLSFNFSVNMSIALTNPLFVSIGMFSGIPLNALIDWIWREARFSALQLVGSLCLLTSFSLMLIPAHWTPAWCNNAKGTSMLPYQLGGDSAEMAALKSEEVDDETMVINETE